MSVRNVSEGASPALASVVHGEAAGTSAPPGLSFARSKALAEIAHRLIPGGAHTYAKGDDQYPVLSPGFISRGNGSHVWDVDGNEYIEYGMGNRAVGLGHAYPDVVAAVRSELERGCNFTRPSSVEVDCAQAFLGLVHGAEMVKFCKNGSDATSGAVRLARAHTGRSLVGLCADHPFFSSDDWFIGTTAVDAGVPGDTKALTVGFQYGDVESARALFARHPGQIACLIMEASRLDDPPPDYLPSMIRLCHESGALFVLDEMITGFRWHASGAQALYGIEPDLSCFGKALGNGFSVSALAGKREFMRLGGLEHTDRPRVFLLSTTHGAETHALAAAIANMMVYAREPVIERVHALGVRLRTMLDQVIARHGLAPFVRVLGKPCNMVVQSADRDGMPSQAFRSLMLQEMVRGHILMPSLVLCYSHTEDDLARTADAFDGALEIYVRALNDGVERYLVGRPSQVVYRRFNTVAA